MIKKSSITKERTKMNNKKENTKKEKTKIKDEHDLELIEKLTNIPKLKTDAPNPPVPNRARTEI